MLPNEQADNAQETHDQSMQQPGPAMGAKIPPLKTGFKTGGQEGSTPAEKMIGKLVIAPTINIPERSVKVGDVNVTADLGSALEKLSKE
jgi:hypothetical protein